MTQFAIQNISVDFGKKRALDNVSLPAVEGGQVLGLLGPNAAGKSTLMRAITGAQKHSGDVLLDEKPRQQFSHANWHMNVAFMPQTPPQGTALLPIELMWSAAKSLRIGLSNKQLERRIESIFQSLELEEFALKPLSALSGGKRQLVGLALCLLRQPKVLLLDEPTSALDLYWRMVVLDLVADYARTSGAIVVAALHDIDLAVRYCDQIAIINHGELVATGTPSEVITSENLANIYHIEADISLGRNQLPHVDIIKPIRGLKNEAFNINF